MKKLLKSLAVLMSAVMLFQVIPAEALPNLNKNDVIISRPVEASKEFVALEDFIADTSERKAWKELHGK